ncbi:hypothetical protein IFR05_006068 [Cadophora sp. M221]|nr:hypothetical protein IFR05_006068 [Cadophora sp. M221]
MESSQNTFEYSSLDAAKSEIRLLRLQPASTYDDEVYCELFHASLDDEPVLPYETVSYTWGKSDATRPSYIYLHGQPFNVTPNLKDALQCLRLTDKSRVIWIDAICINQQSLADRASQVALMHLIYRQTSGGLFWLGKVANMPEPAFQFLKSIENNAECSTIPEFTKLVLDKLAQLESAEWPIVVGPISRFLREPPAWGRVWILQEFCLPTEVQIHFGTEGKTLDWWPLAVVWFSCTRLFGQFPAESEETKVLEELQYNCLARSMLSTRILMLSSSRNPLPLKDIIMVLGLLDATEPRDFLYSILGLIEFGSGVFPDYEISQGQALCLSVGKILAESGSVGLLELSGFYSRRPSHKGLRLRVNSLPSWMPDMVTVRKMKTGDGYYSAGTSVTGLPDVAPIVYDPTNPSELGVHGAIVDTVESISPWTNALPLEHESPGEIYPRNFLSCLPEDHSSNYFDGTSKFQAYWRTLMFDENSGENRRLAEEDLDTYERFFANFLGLEKPGQSEREVEDNEELQRNFLEAFGNGELYFSFAATSKGYFAMVPDGTEVGDGLAVFHGGEVPFVLRQLAVDSDKIETPKRKLCELIGPAYVHGLMDGLAMKWLKGGKPEENMLTLV